MSTPVTVNDLTPISGSVQTSRISYAVEPAGKNYGQNYGGKNWYSDIPNDGTYYTIVTDNYTANYYTSRSEAGGGYVEGGIPAVDEYSAPVFWITTGTASANIITTVNGLPDRIGEEPFVSGSHALEWLASSSNYFAIGPDYYRDIDADNLVLFVQANQIISYPTTGSNWYDVSGYSNNVTLVNGLENSWDSNGYFNFDGTDDYGTITSDSSMNSNVFSVEALVRLGVADNNIRTIASRGGNPGAATNGWWMGTLRNGLGGGQNEFRFMWWGTSAYLDRVTSIGANDLRWHHMVATSDGTTGTVYIDGVFNTSATLPAGNLYTDGDAYLIGIADTLGNPWSGSIAQEKFYPKALSATDIAQNYYGGPIVTDSLELAVDAGNLVSYPKSGTSVYDLTSNSNDGTLYNGVSYFAQNGGYWDFDGSNDYAKFSLNGVDLDNECTIEMWTKRNSTPAAWRTYMNIVPNGATVPFFEFRTSAANTITSALYYDGAINYATPSYTLNLNEFYHLTATWQSSTNTIKFYVDGAFVGQNNTIPNFGIGPDPVLQMAIAYDGTRNTDISIASARIYSKALTADEVAQNYNATN